MNIRYKFYVDGREMNPAIYSNDLSMDISPESGQEFTRRKLSGTLVFQREDFVFIAEKSIEAEMTLKITRSKDKGAFYDYYISKFSKTDCSWNYDNRTVSIKVETDDGYTDVLAGLDKEFDLIKLSPKIQKCMVVKRPCVQLHIENDSSVTSYASGTYWEQDVINDAGLTQNMWAFSSFMLTFTMSNGTIYTGVLYRNNVSSGTNYEGTAYDDKGLYRMEIAMNTVDTSGTTTFKIYGINNGTLYWEGETYAGVSENGELLWEDTINMQMVTPPVTNVTMTWRSNYIQSRILTDRQSMTGYDLYRITSEDALEINPNYKYGAKVSFSNVVFVSARKTDTPNKWGMDSNGKYFLPPEDEGGYLPLSKSNWTNSSYWFKYNDSVNEIDRIGRNSFVLNDAYPIYSVIQVLLNEIAPGITHSNTTAYSQFLYSGSDPISHKDINLIITPTSNLKKAGYDQPAMKAPITLGEVLSMLYNTFKLKWHIKDSKLIIEHIQYYYNGGTYESEQQIGLDLTTTIQPSNNKSWCMGQNSFEYDKDNSPERFQFSWANDVTEPFEGYPIEVKSNTVQKGNIEEITVGKFTSDVDFILSNPNQIADDGFVVMSCFYNNTLRQYTLPFVERTISGFTYNLQNGYLAYIVLQPDYWVYDMPGRTLIINNAEYVAQSVTRKMKQSIKFPTYDDIDPMALIKTDLGVGKIDKCTVSLSTRMNNVTLKY